MNLRRTAAVVGLCLTLPFLATGTAAASGALHTADGRRCTIVGTPGPDVLVGTSHADVICGRGGNDRIIGKGGNDAIDGGSGRDTIASGPGRDDVIAGSGNDHVTGGGGVDDVSGGTGNDTLSGNGAGDTISGGGGNDTLAGGAGDDDLTGGAGSDTLSGGAGTNWCTPDGDVETGCVYDRAIPSSIGATFLESRVDVTRSDATVTVRVHAADDTGVRVPQVNVVDGTGNYDGWNGTLVKGTVRDGWWDLSVRIPHGAPAGNYHPEVNLTDRAGRTSNVGDPMPATLQVIDGHADARAPQVTVLSAPVATQTVDVRSAAKNVAVQARVTDDQSVAYVYPCLFKELDTGWTNLPCGSSDLTSGSKTNGVWTGQANMPKGEQSGTWNVGVVVGDKAGHQVWYVGPDVATAPWHDPNFVALPDGAGRFTVVGAPADTHPPVLVSAALSPNQARTLTAAAPIAVTLHITDVEGVRSASALLASAADSIGNQLMTSLTDLRLASGSAKDGTWTGTLMLPRGTPPGIYYLEASVDDVAHATEWMSPDSPQAYMQGYPSIPGDDHVTVLAQ